MLAPQAGLRNVFVQAAARLPGKKPNALTIKAPIVMFIFANSSNRKG